MENQRPHSLEETILHYLRQQENYLTDYGIEYFPQAETNLVKEIEPTPEEQIKILLEDLKLKVSKRILCKDQYDNLQQWHNQFPLFDLENIIPDFCIDEEMMDRMSFKESLLISEIDSSLDSKLVEPHPIGCLCLNVQVVDGRVDIVDELNPLTEEEKLNEEIKKILIRTQKFLVTSKKPFTVTELNETLEQVLKDYKKFLEEKAKNNIKKIIVHLSSEFEVDGRNAGSFISSWVDRQFHTLEEKRKEWIKGEDLEEKSLYVALQREKYYVHYKSKRDNSDIKKYENLTRCKDYVSEGASFVLMRYLAIIQYKGTFELSTFYLNGNPCRNIYECIGPAQGIIEDREIKICKIYRYIIEQCGIEHRSVTVLTTNGQIISQEWEGCDIILNRNPLMFIESKAPCGREILTKTWMNDMELLSKYLDYKTILKKEMKTYVEDHAEIEAFVADYLNNILLMKPETILPFTLDYFQSLCNIDLGRASYFEHQTYEFD